MYRALGLDAVLFFLLVGSEVYCAHSMTACMYYCGIVYDVMLCHAMLYYAVFSCTVLPYDVS